MCRKPDPPASTPIPTLVNACPCPVTLLIGAQMTAEPRSTDAENARKHVPPTTVQVIIQERVQGDRNFLRKAITCQERMNKSGRFTHHKILIEGPSTGEELLAAMERASSWGQIKNLVFWGHSGPYGVYGKENRALYRKSDDFDDLDRPGGARFFDDFREKIHTSRTIVFARDALCMFCGCKAAGDRGLERDCLASWFAEDTRGTVIGSVAGSDQSQAPSWEVETSQKYWARHTRGRRDGEKMSAADTLSGNAKNLDVLKHLRV